MPSVKLGITIPTLLCADLLMESVESLSKQSCYFDCCYIIDNGNQVLPLDDPKFKVYCPGRNLGVAASWNRGLSYLFQSYPITHVLCLNDDIVLYENQLETIIEGISAFPSKWFLVGTFHWSVWVMGRPGYLGTQWSPGKCFDPAFWPGYCEDNDFDYRINLINPGLIEKDLPFLTPRVKRNSETAKRSPIINHERSLKFYKKKWGGSPGHEIFTTPFNGE